MQDDGGVPLRPRERIISTARDLFRKHGIRGVGVDAIAEAAGTNKMTLYRHFGSKDDLIIACLRDVASEVDDRFGSASIANMRMIRWDSLARGFASVPSAFSTMAAVAISLMPRLNLPKAIIRRGMSLREFKRDQRNRLTKLCRRGRNRESRFACGHFDASARRRPRQPSECWH